MKFNHLSGLIIIFCAFFWQNIRAAPPSWWATGSPPVIDPNAFPDNQGAASIGQAKWMAKRALESLSAVDSLTASLIEKELVGVGKPIPSWSAPSNSLGKEAQKAPLLIGQLKAISAPFYRYLNAVNPDWLTSQRILNLADFESSYFPWTADPEDDDNRSIANIGQLKVVFSLRFETYDVVAGTSYELWAERYFGVDHEELSDGDFDMDGRTNAQEFADNTSPKDNNEVLDPAAVRYSYAPDLKWIGATRTLFYDYAETNPSEGQSPEVLPTSQIVTGGFFYGARGRGGPSPIQSRLQISGLHQRLKNAIPFDLQPSWDGASHLVVGPNSVALRHSCTVNDHNERVSIDHKQVRLYSAYLKAPENITKGLIIGSYVGNPAIYIGHSVRQFTVPKGATASEPITFGDNVSLTPGLNSTQIFLHPDFSGPEQALMFGGPRGVDATKGTLWTSIRKGSTIVVYLDLNGLPGEIASDLEVVGENDALIDVQASNVFGAGQFTITGLNETSAGGVGIFLRSRNSTSSAFVVASMRLHVLPRRQVPVSIYRVYDDRVPASKPVSGPSDSDIIDQLNAVYGYQSEIEFLSAADSGPVNLKDVPGGGFFAADGTFNMDRSFDVTKITEAINGKDFKRISVHIVKKFPTGTILASSSSSFRYSYLPENAVLQTFAHEVGHCLGLAVDNWDGFGHDDGPWPKEWARTGGWTGLMYDSRHPNREDWIRREDWQRSNFLAELAE